MEVKRGYKQTDVGVIPEEWEVKTLNSISTISRLAGAEYTSLWEETPNGEIIALRGFNIGQGKIIERDLVRISNRLSLKLKRSRLCKGDVVYPCVGSIGNAVVITDDAKYHIQQNIARITPNPDAIDSDYLANFLMSSLAEREVDRFTSSSSQPSVLVGSLRQYRVPLPTPLHEQRAIATALSDADAWIESLEQLIAKKRQIKQGAMQELLTGKRRLPGFSGEWEVKRLGACLLASPDYGINAAGVELDSRLPAYLRITDINDDGFLSLLNRVSVNHPDSSNYVLNDNQIVFARTGASVGKAYLFRSTDGKLVFAGFLIRAKVDTSLLNPEFLFAYTQTRHYWNWVRMMSMRSGQPGINGNEYANLEIRLPPTIEEQSAIATILSDMDTEIGSLETKLTKARQIKQGMMQELLTGRIRLV